MTLHDSLAALRNVVSSCGTTRALPNAYGRNRKISDLFQDGKYRPRLREVNTDRRKLPEQNTARGISSEQRLTLVLTL
ncbi:hypothetical protein BaRGS_00007100 [Batillaria attramentaria]|uniref:Uncharacterized protein n=1 Tax=Batillaria attramentaria TaxID=370345 RepID=A0ABD0LRN5_9CAEN